MWTSVDPKASSFPGITPYNYCLSNPLALHDPDGAAPDPVSVGIGIGLGIFHGYQAFESSKNAGGSNLNAWGRATLAFSIDVLISATTIPGGSTIAKVVGTQLGKLVYEGTAIGAMGGAANETANQFATSGQITSFNQIANASGTSAALGGFTALVGGQIGIAAGLTDGATTITTSAVGEVASQVLSASSSNSTSQQKKQ
jgi:hypothetical protein